MFELRPSAWLEAYGANAHLGVICAELEELQKYVTESRQSHCGWGSELTRRVCVEYGRFILLNLVIRDHNCTLLAVPETVQWLWRRHVLRDTHRYALFESSLNARLPHIEWSKANFPDRYGLTWYLYRLGFNESPPSDIWPRPIDAKCQCNSGAREGQSSKPVSEQRSQPAEPTVTRAENTSMPASRTNLDTIEPVHVNATPILLKETGVPAHSTHDVHGREGRSASRIGERKVSRQCVSNNNLENSIEGDVEAVSLPRRRGRGPPRRGAAKVTSQQAPFMPTNNAESEERLSKRCRGNEKERAMVAKTANVEQQAQVIESDTEDELWELIRGQGSVAGGRITVSSVEQGREEGKRIQSNLSSGDKFTTDGIGASGSAGGRSTGRAAHSTNEGQDRDRRAASTERDSVRGDWCALTAQQIGREALIKVSFRTAGADNRTENGTRQSSTRKQTLCFDGIKTAYELDHLRVKLCSAISQCRLRKGYLMGDETSWILSYFDRFGKEIPLNGKVKLSSILEQHGAWDAQANLPTLNVIVTTGASAGDTTLVN